VIATGGLARLIAPLSRTIQEVDDILNSRRPAYPLRAHAVCDARQRRWCACACACAEPERGTPTPRALAIAALLLAGALFLGVAWGTSRSR